MARSPEAKELRERLVDELIRRPMTRDDVAAVLRIQPESATSAVRRLRESGLPIEVVDSYHAGDSERGKMTDVYRIVYSAGRVCAQEGCGTILRRGNPSDRCELHGGGFIPYAKEKPLSPPFTCRICGKRSRDRASTNWVVCRPCYNVYKRKHKAREGAA